MYIMDNYSNLPFTLILTSFFSESVLFIATLNHFYTFNNIFCHIMPGLVSHKRKSLNDDLRLIAKNSVCLFDLLFYVPVNSYGHVEALANERDVNQ